MVSFRWQRLPWNLQESKRRGWSNLTVVYSQNLHLNGFTQTPDSEPSCFAKLIRVGIVILVLSVRDLGESYRFMASKKSGKKQNHQGWWLYPIISCFFFFSTIPNRWFLFGHGDFCTTEAFHLPMHCRKRGGMGRSRLFRVCRGWQSYPVIWVFP